MSAVDIEIDLSVDEENTFADLVHGRPWLYDRSSNDYKNKLQKENSWEEIASIFKLTVPEAIKMWDSIKNKYIRVKQQLDAASRSGSAATKTVNWTPFQKLQSMFKRNERRNSLCSIQDDFEVPQAQSKLDRDRKPYERQKKVDKEVTLLSNILNNVHQTTHEVKSFISQAQDHATNIDNNDADELFGLFMLAKLNEADRKSRKCIHCTTG